MHLRVWFETESKNKQDEGIVVGSFGDGQVGTFIVRTDSGELLNVYVVDVVKSEWVNHPTNAD